jgi:hypothetical protein
MLYFQKWSENSFEYKFLKFLKDNIKEPNFNLYIGFDYGFFLGINIFYSNKDAKKHAEKIYISLKNNNQKIKLLCNSDISKNFDVIILLGYSNLSKEKRRLSLNKKKILKALSFY